MEAAVEATPKNPNNPAAIAIIKNAAAHPNMGDHLTFCIVFCYNVMLLHRLI